MKEFFEELFTYNQMVNQKVIEVITGNKEKVTNRTNELIGHILLVHQSWNNRMKGKEGLSNFWEIINPENLTALNSENTAISFQIIKTYELQESFSYKNSKGAAFSNTFQDVLFHLINHSSYHRGQINAQLRSAAIEPVVTDFIFYKR